MAKKNAIYLITICLFLLACEGKDTTEQITIDTEHKVEGSVLDTAQSFTESEILELVNNNKKEQISLLETKGYSFNRVESPEAYFEGDDPDNVLVLFHHSHVDTTNINLALIYLDENGNAERTLLIMRDKQKVLDIEKHFALSSYKINASHYNENESFSGSEMTSRTYYKEESPEIIKFRLFDGPDKFEYRIELEKPEEGLERMMTIGN